MDNGLVPTLSFQLMQVLALTMVLMVMAMVVFVCIVMLAILAMLLLLLQLLHTFGRHFQLASISIVAAGIYDLIKSYPLMTTIKDILIWIWENIINADIKLWIVLLLFLLMYTVSRIIRSLNKNSHTQPEYLGYKTDQFDGYTWKWDYNYQSGAYNINNLIPLCPKCNTRMHYNFGLLNSWEAKCPRCRYQNARMRDRKDIVALIIDNVDKGKT
jgi:hypothetical protein